MQPLATNWRRIKFSGHKLTKPRLAKKIYIKQWKTLKEHIEVFFTTTMNTDHMKIHFTSQKCIRFILFLINHLCISYMVTDWFVYLIPHDEQLWKFGDQFCENIPHRGSENRVPETDMFGICCFARCWTDGTGLNKLLATTFSLFNPLRHELFFYTDFYETLRPGVFSGADYVSVFRFSKFKMADLIWRTQKSKPTDFRETKYLGVFCIFDHESIIRFPKFEMVDTIWRTQKFKFNEFLWN